MIYSFTRMLDPDQAVFGGSALRPILDAIRAHEGRRPHGRHQAQAARRQLQRGAVRLHDGDRAGGLRALRRRSDQPDRHRSVQAAGVRGRRAVDPHPQRELLGHRQAVLRRGAHHRLRRQRRDDQRPARRPDRLPPATSRRPPSTRSTEPRATACSTRPAAAG